MKVKVFGCRGSMARSHAKGSRYGGNTSCMSVESNGQLLIIDAGSGLMMFEDELRAAYPGFPNHLPPTNILISHLHIDHIMGLSVFAPLGAAEADVNIYTCSRDERPLDEQVFGIFAPPYWPVAMKDVSRAKCVPIQANIPFVVGPFTVTPFVASHPDKTLSFCITDGHKRFVHLLDNEVDSMNQTAYEELLNFCHKADMVVFDSAYSEEDYARFMGWGHSTVRQGVELARACKAKRMMFCHFGQQYSDDQIDSWARFFEKETCCEFIMGSDGMEVDLQLQAGCASGRGADEETCDCICCCTCRDAISTGGARHFSHPRG